MAELESLLLENLTTNEQFVRTALPYIKTEYFPLEHQQKMFEIIRDYVSKYNRPPTQAAILIELDGLNSLSQDDYTSIISTVQSWTGDVQEDQTWLRDTAETWCQDRALFNALGTCVQLAQDTDEGSGLSRGSIPEIMAEALGVSFDQAIGIKYMAEADERYEWYHDKKRKIPTNITKLNYHMNGGYEEATLNCIMGSTGTGKSIWLCDFAADDLLKGKNVLYVTMELAEIKIAERIDANIMDVDVNDLTKISKTRFGELTADIANRTTGELVIKQYPPTTAHAGHFRHLLNELRLKQNFVPDVIYIDYINICASSRLSRGKSSSYEYVKSIAEEIRGLAVETGIPVWTATQSNKSAATDSNVGIDAVSESWGLPQTVDFFMVIITDENLKKSGQQMVKILKSRYGPCDISFMVNIDYGKMRIFNQDTYDGSADDDPPPWMDDGPAEPQSRFTDFSFNNAK